MDLCVLFTQFFKGFVDTCLSVSTKHRKVGYERERKSKVIGPGIEPMTATWRTNASIHCLHFTSVPLSHTGFVYILWGKNNVLYNLLFFFLEKE